MVKNYLDSFLENAIIEDIGDGDHTSLACIPPDAEGEMKLLVKQSGVLAGVEIAIQIFYKIDPTIKLSIWKNDGEKVITGDVVFNISGKVHTLLKSERLVLNIMQRMSGIATETARYVKQLEGLKTKVLDTRKTTPGLRGLEKSAVIIGGGTNHRMGLYDMIMVKDNHIDFSGGIEQAITKTQKYLKDHNKDLKIEVEARSLDEVKEILKMRGVHRIMLDNFSLADTIEAVALVDGKMETESSGGITFDTIRDYAQCGVDFVSVGALTHQIKSLDMSLKAV